MIRHQKFHIRKGYMVSQSLRYVVHEQGRFKSPRSYSQMKWVLKQSVVWKPLNKKMYLFNCISVSLHSDESLESGFAGSDGRNPAVALTEKLDSACCTAGHNCPFWSVSHSGAITAPSFTSLTHHPREHGYQTQTTALWHCNCQVCSNTKKCCVRNFWWIPSEMQMDRGGKQVMENCKHTQQHKELLRQMIGEVKNK